MLLFVALGTRFARTRRTGAIVAIAALAFVSFVACYYLGLTRGSRFVFYQLTFRFWELACGVLLFLVGNRIDVLSGSWSRLYNWSGWLGLVLVVAAMGVPNPQAFPWVRATLAVIGAMLMIGLPTVERFDRLRRVLSSPVSLWIGQRSYALYLWHWPVYVLARWTTGLTAWPFNVLAMVLSFIAAAVSYRWLENPVRQSAALKRWHPAARIAAFVLLLAFGWWCGRSLLDAQPRLGLGQPTREAHDWYGDRNLLKTQFANRRKCEPRVVKSGLDDVKDVVTKFVPYDCGERTAQQLFVLGDSHAAAYLPMLEQVSAEQGRTVVVLQAPGCAYLNLLSPMDASGDHQCFRMAQAAMKTVLDQARSGDIVFLPSLRLPRLIELGGAKRRTEGLDKSSSPIDRFALSSDELYRLHAASIDAPQWFVPFLDAGLHVLFELPKPIFEAHPFQCVDWFNRNNPACASGLSELRANQERYRAPIVDAVRQLGAEHPGLPAWDPLPTLCDAQACNALMARRPLFFDGDHLSPYGNAVLLPLFAQAISTLSGERPPTD